MIFISDFTIREVGSGEHRALYEHMCRDFPSNELPPFSAVNRNLENHVYHGLFLVRDEDIGYAVMLPGEEFALLNFFAILPKNRSGGYGSEFLKIICKMYPKVILEAEDPAKMPEPETALRRIRFYERAGFSIQPTRRARIFGVDMVIMSNAAIEAGGVRQLMHSLYRPTFSSRRWLRFIDVRDAETLTCI